MYNDNVNDLMKAEYIDLKMSNIKFHLKAISIGYTKLYISMLPVTDCLNFLIVCKWNLKVLDMN